MLSGDRWGPLDTALGTAETRGGPRLVMADAVETEVHVKTIFKKSGLYITNIYIE